MRIIAISIVLCFCSCSKESTLKETTPKVNVRVVDSKFLTNITVERYYTEYGVSLYNTVTITPNWEYVMEDGRFYYTPELPIGTSLFNIASYGASCPFVIKKVEQSVGDAIRNYNSGDGLIRKLVF